MYYKRQPYPNELYHYGIQGQKWGLRRFQNPDGTLTAAGKARYGYSENENPHDVKVKKGSLLERRYARQEMAYSKAITRTKNKAKEASHYGETYKAERLQNRQKKLEVGLKKTQDLAEIYYSKDPESRKKINRGYAAIQIIPAIVLGGGGLTGPVLAASTYAAGKYAENKLKYDN